MALSQSDRSLALSSFSFLAKAPEDVQHAFFSNAIYKQLPAGSYICMDGQDCAILPMVISGVARVYKAGETGREITLYRINQGELCILSGACLLQHRTFPAYAVAETDLEAFLVPADIYQGWMQKHQAWQKVVFAAFAERLSILVETVEAAIFSRLDQRIATLLLNLSNSNDPHPKIATTHEALATELGSSREVVSRLLKGFEKDGILKLGRGTIAITSIKALVEIGQGNPNN